MKLSVIVPAYNEKPTIKEILTRIEKAPYDKEIIVVDDASTDGTRQVLEQMNAERLFPSARFIYHSVNQGKGAALRTGIREVAGDIVFQRTHVWLAESSPKTRKAWLAALRKLAGRHPKTVVAGHKRTTESPDSPGAIAFTRDYIRAFEAAKASSHNADELISKMKQSYSEVGLDVILTSSANAALPK